MTIRLDGRLPGLLLNYPRDYKVRGGNVMSSTLGTLHPFGVIMAGANEFDPYKD